MLQTDRKMDRKKRIDRWIERRGGGPVSWLRTGNVKPGGTQTLIQKVLDTPPNRWNKDTLFTPFYLSFSLFDT